MSEMAPFYAQVIGIGLLWVTVHCIGMCGPILASLTAGMGVGRAPTVPARVWRATKGVLAYQSGRALIYAGLGAAAGFAGAVAQEWIEAVAQTAGLVVAVAVLGVGIGKLLPVALAPSGDGGAGVASRWTVGAMRFIGRFIPSTGVLRMAAFGLVLGFLPCVLMFWILGIAASTTSPFHGAMVMLLLVAMTTPVLIFAACGTSLPGVFSHLRSDRVIGGAMLVSGVWLLMIGLAANGWVEHLHIPLEIGEQELVIMLW